MSADTSDVASYSILTGLHLFPTVSPKNIQDIQNTFWASRKHAAGCQSLINNDGFLEVDSLRREICEVHTKTVIVRHACGRLKPVSVKSPRV